VQADAKTPKQNNAVEVEPGRNEFGPTRPGPCGAGRGENGGGAVVWLSEHSGTGLKKI
jgi:hypothetical protein